MKVLTLVIHKNAQQDLADLLRAHKHVPGFTFSHVEGHGVQAENNPFLSMRDKVVGYTPRVRVDILLEDAHVAAVLEALRNGHDFKGQGVYWVSPVEQSGHL